MEIMEEICSYSMRRRCLVPVFLPVCQHVDIAYSNMDLSIAMRLYEKQ